MSTTKRIILVGTRYKAISQTWTEHPDSTIDEVLAKIRDRVSDNNRAMEVMEVEVVRRVELRPIVSEVDVREETP